MKLLRFIFIFISLYSFLSAQNISINLHTGDLQSAIRKAQLENKYILIDCYTDWCEWCKVMDTQTLTDTTVIQFLNSHFIFCKFDMEIPEHGPLHAKYRISGFPGYLILNSDGERVYQFVGYCKPDMFVESLTKAMAPDHQIKCPGISKELDPGFPKEYLAMFGTKNPPYYKPQVADSLLRQRTDWFDEVSWAILVKMRTPRKYNQFVLDNLKTYESLYGSEAKEYLDVYTHQLYNMIPDSSGISQLVELMAHIDQYYPDSMVSAELKSYYQKDYFLQQQNWETVEGLLSDRWHSRFKIDPNEINRDGWIIYTNCPKVSLIQLAERKLNEINQKEKDYYLLDTQAALLSKLGKTEEAIALFQLAIATGKESKVDVEYLSETEKLLAKLLDPNSSKEE